MIGGLLAAGLALLLVSCGSTRHSAPPRAEELTGYVLVIEEAPDGQVHHSWQLATGFDLSRYDLRARVGGTTGSILLASSRPRDCDQEHIDCFRDCMKRRLPAKWNHLKREDGSKSRYCSTECLRQYQDCLKLQQSHALQFTSTNEAVDWLKRHRTELLVGGIVVIAGAAFVILSAGAGLVVLAPVVLVAG
ncbi:hypothetical protein [Pyxidicoccus trucidator]|uniref:hypothetical protein n=1 Tax=Pyxidicoccus trucidator TaxID=2709662 RepID=UPI0013DBC502|nr:hypothetical protein [Pyxidicoccus trucidator]